MPFKLFVLLLLPGLLFPAWAGASSAAAEHHPYLLDSVVGMTSLFLFVLGYLVVMTEEFSHLRKSKPMLLVAGIIWGMLAWVYGQMGYSAEVEEVMRHNLEEYAELMLFLLVAMTYVNALNERKMFDALRVWLVSRGFNYRKLFWITGLTAFFLSPIADNLTTALVMCAVVLAVGVENRKFVSIACINIVVASNAGGAFSPFGDITTLMVWQKGQVDFWSFFNLFIPSLVNFLIPAMIMYFAIPNISPAPVQESIVMKRGAKTIAVLFLCTIITAISFHNFLHIPPVFGMMTGLSFLQFFGFYLRRKELRSGTERVDTHKITAFDIFNKIARVEWDTLLFFYGVIMSVAGLGFLGYLTVISELMYTGWGATYANILVGALSAIIDNIPVMFAVLSMNPDMPLGQWLLVTLTAGVGGSLLSIGSAAGVALMGQARGQYTFFSHLKWTPVIALGYLGSIGAHMLLNRALF
jgi:NhaD family Na+/H+ antiporter